MNKLNVVLLEPEIPQNTGNIARTCAATGTSLHLIKPFGFELSDKYLKRAGLDYWKYLDLTVYENIEEFFEKNKGECFYFSTKAKKLYSDENFSGNVFMFFGKETKGLPESLLKENYDHALRLPMLDEIRSLNLSNSVAIAVYEVYRQWNFQNFKIQGAIPER